MTAPILYAYRRDTGEFLAAIAADPDPEVPGGWLHPAFAVEVPPPAAGAGEAAVFTGEAWGLVADRRGETWYAPGGAAVTVSELGEPSAFDPPLSAQAPPTPPVDLAAHASRCLASVRDGGVGFNGVRIKTDAESRGLIDGADALCQRDPAAAIDFKAASGWVKLDAAMMREVALAVGRWVQACYSTYRTVSDAIAAGTITSAAQIDDAFAALERPE